MLHPKGFRANTSNPDKISFTNQDFSCVLSFRVVSPGSAAVSAPNNDLCRGWRAARLVDLRACLKTPERGCVVDQPQQALNFQGLELSAPCCGWSTTQPRSFFRQALSIQEEFSLTVPSGSGPAFDLKCKVDGVVRSPRMAFIASSVGVLEFNSLSSPEEAEAAKLNFRVLSRGFRISDTNGQFEILPSQSES